MEYDPELKPRIVSRMMENLKAYVAGLACDHSRISSLKKECEAPGYFEKPDTKKQFDLAAEVSIKAIERRDQGKTVASNYISTCFMRDPTNSKQKIGENTPYCIYWSDEGLFIERACEGEAFKRIQSVYEKIREAHQLEEGALPHLGELLKSGPPIEKDEGLEHWLNVWARFRLYDKDLKELGMAK